MYERRGGSVFGAFLLGGLVGAVLGLLFAPRSGKETREMIAERAEDYWGQGVDMYNTGKERAGEMYEAGREKVAEQSDQLRTKIDEARGRLQEQVAKSAESAKGAVDKAAPATKEAIDKTAQATRGAVDVAGTKASDTLGVVSEKARTKTEAPVAVAEPPMSEGGPGL